MSQTNYGEKKCVGSILILLRCFLLVFYFVFFYILTYYFYQILGNAPYILFLSAITKHYFCFCNFYHFSMTELSTSTKYINKISNYTIV